MSFLEIENVNFNYPGGFTALRDVTLSARAGEFICIVGPSGCGKSTMLDIIDGLAPTTAGRVRIDGKQVSKPGPDRAMVFQAPGLLPWRTVAGNIAFALECSHRSDLANESSEQRRKRIDRLIRL